MDDESVVSGSRGQLFQTPASRGRRVERTLRLKASKTASCLALAFFTGCRTSGPVAPEYVPNNWLGHASIAVAPAINLSGSRDFDPNRVADLMAVELGYVQGVRVIPVSRVLGVLAVQGMEGIASPEHAVEVAQWVGADAILVFAITEYDPFDPPRVGMTAQLFGAGTEAATDNASPPTEPARGRSSPPVLAETQRVFDASHLAIITEVQEFAKRRSADDSPYGWRKYVVTQEGFVEFCCHRTVTALARQPFVTAATVVQGR